MSKLSTYLQDNEISGRAFAAALGVNPSIVSRLKATLITPGLDLAVKIERVTNGAVPATSWVPEENRQPEAKAL